jgi:NTE family protein
MTLFRSVAALGLAVAQAGSCAWAVGSEPGWCAAMLSIPVEPTTRAFIDDPSAPGGKAERAMLMSLTLSGGGYRAMLFHVGTLMRLNDAGMLPRLAVVSSVSGGSVASAYLAYRWPDLTFDAEDRAKNFAEVIERPLRSMAATTLDIPSVVAGLLPFTSAAERQVEKFDEHLFHGARLADIAPGGGMGTARPRPLFILNATSLQTGELWQFRAQAMGGPITGWTTPGETLLSQAVAASSGFPPLLSPMVLTPAGAGDDSRWHDCVDYRDNPYGVAYANEPGRVLPPDRRAEHRKAVHLIDGGVRDNLGIAAIEEMNRVRRLDKVHRVTVALISDGGATTPLDPDPPANWIGQTGRVLTLLADQPDEVRVGHLIRTGSARLRGFGWNPRPARPGCTQELPPPKLDEARRLAALDTQADTYAYWSIRRMPKMHSGFGCPSAKERWMADEVAELSVVPTAFRAMPDSLQARLVNWGYLATHHGLPYVDFAWPDLALRQRWLAPCALPYGPDTTLTDSARDAACATLQAGAADGAPGMAP